MKSSQIIVVVLASLSSAAFANEWVRSNDGYIPSHAWAVGRDINDAPLFLCRAKHNGGMHPGKIRKDFNGCHISFAGQEINKNEYQVFRFRPDGEWVETWGGQIPDGAMRVGHDTSGEPLYLCKARYQDSVQIGKASREIGGCDVPFANSELHLTRYKVFVQD